MADFIKLAVLFCLFCPNLFAQRIQPDSLEQNINSEFNYKKLIIPTALISYGFIGLESEGIKRFNLQMRSEMDALRNRSTYIDDYSQYVPMVSVYALNAMGVKGKHNFKDRTTALGTAYVIMGATVQGLKRLTAIQRPDGTAYNAFPSGHTATAFMAAEFLNQEFKEVSVWYGISGYMVAACTGFLRMYNNRHWFTDVVTGAGIGILSTKLAYQIAPFVKKIVFGDNDFFKGIKIDFHAGEMFGVALSASF